MKDELQRALDSSKSLGLTVPTFEYINSRLLTDERLEQLSYLTHEVFGELQGSEIAGQCIAISMQMMPLIETVFGIKPVFTIGWVSVEDRKWFYQDIDSLERMLKEGVNGDELNIHAWLTLPTLEVLDFTLASSFAVAKGIPEMERLLIARHADELTGMSFHPVLTGEEFIFRAGMARFGVL